VFNCTPAGVLRPASDGAVTLQRAASMSS